MKSRLIITMLGVLMSASPSVFAQASKILELKEPGLKERVAVAGVFELPKVNSR